LQYARLLAEDVRVVYVDLAPEATATRRAAWKEWADDVPLVLLESPYWSIVQLWRMKEVLLFKKGLVVTRLPCFLKR
jgi:hypothetical protein